LSAALYLIEIYFEPSVTTKLFTAITLGLLHAHMRASHLMRAQNVNAFEPGAAALESFGFVVAAACGLVNSTRPFINFQALSVCGRRRN
jgi:hypothetical protein